MRRAGAAVQRRQAGGEIARARQRVNLSRVAHDNAVERRHQAEQPQPHQHMQPAAAVADHHFHRLRQRVVNIGQGSPVAHAAGKNHHANRQHGQGQDAAAQRPGNGALRILRLFGGHRCAFNRQKEPDSERDGGKHPRQRQAAEALRARPAVSGKVAPREARRDHAHKYQQLEDR